jgi:acetoin utilization protein AcuC
MRIQEINNRTECYIMSSFIYSDDYLKYQFGPAHPFKSIRCKKAMDILKDMGVFNDDTNIIRPSPASYEDLLLVHTREYVDYVRRKSEAGHGLLDLGDTPATKGLFEGSSSVVGGSILGAKRVIDGEDTHAFNVGGGLHHARADAASGFCVFNDIAVAARWLQKYRGIRRIAIVDIDGHHGDGTQAIFYEEPLLKISSHRIGIFPGTGYVDEAGEAAGKGYSVNIPLPGGTGDEAYLYAFKTVVPPMLEWYKPEIIFLQCGIDGHVGDPLVGLSLTTKTYEAVVASLHEVAHRLCNGRLVLFGGGGYDVETTARCWALVFAIVSGAVSSSKYASLRDIESTSDDSITISRVKDVVSQIKESIFKIHELA